jgi:hypothetical protein
MSQAPISSSVQAKSTAPNPSIKGPATVYVAKYESTASGPGGRQYGTCAIYIRNETGRSLLQRIYRAPDGRYVVDALKYNTVGVKAELESPVDVGKIPRGGMAAVRNVLNKHKPDGRRVGGRYDSKV